jgi:hypothetical protein
VLSGCWKERREGGRTKKRLKEIMAENFPQMAKKINL